MGVVSLKAMNELIERAQQILVHAYAPYSRFPVAAVLRSDSGKIYCGVNVENRSYPASRCAEQNAVAAMVTGGERVIAEIVIMSRATPPATPCGICRQVLCEFAGTELPVLSTNLAGEEQRFTLGELLPHAFSSDLNHEH